MFYSKLKKTLHTHGFSLIDVLIGVAIIGLVLVAIFGVFRLSVTIVTTSKSRAGAVSLATDQMEFLRSLEYDAVGTDGGIPSGAIPQVEVISLNSINYSRRTFIQYVDDVADGVGGDDENGIQTDYKIAKVEVTWLGKNGEQSVSAVSRIVPDGIETVEGGGTLTINVIDASASPVPDAEVTITNDDVSPAINITTSTNTNGVVNLPGAPEDTNYDIVITKSGFSTAQTYEADATNVDPSPGPATVIEGNTTSLTFQIDLVSTHTVLTFEQESEDSFEDEFSDLSQVSFMERTMLDGGAIQLGFNGPNHFATGTVFSMTIEPDDLSEWGIVSLDYTAPASTTLVYHIYRTDGGVSLVSDGDLPGNSTGFTSSTLDISSLDAIAYPSLQVEAYFETEDLLATPLLSKWSVSYSVGLVPFPDVPFVMKGSKTIGEDAGSNPIYKYEESLQTDSTGELVISDLEWDIYTITVDDDSFGYDIAESCFFQPRAINPGISTTTSIVLAPDTPHTLLVSVVDTNSYPIVGASVRLYRTDSPTYDETLLASTCGQSFFSSVPQGTSAGGNAYSLDVSASGYTSQLLTDIDVSDVSTLSITLSP